MKKVNNDDLLGIHGGVSNKIQYYLILLNLYQDKRRDLNLEPLYLHKSNYLDYLLFGAQ